MRPPAAGRDGGGPSRWRGIGSITPIARLDRLCKVECSMSSDIERHVPRFLVDEQADRERPVSDWGDSPAGRPSFAGFPGLRQVHRLPPRTGAMSAWAVTARMPTRSPTHIAGCCLVDRPEGYP